MSPDLEVDINGQETFFVNKEILASCSGILRNLFNKPATAKPKKLKVMFNNFPGGAMGFELIVKYCYNGGKIEVTPSSVFLLHFAAKYMEIKEEQTEKYFENIHNCTWSDLLDCLKQWQELPFLLNSSYMLRKILDSLIDKISIFYPSSTYTFTIQFSGDTSTNSISSARSSSFSRINWLRDLEFLNIVLFEKMVKIMGSKKLDQEIICSFLLYYQKVKFSGISPLQKGTVISIVIDSLSLFDESFNIPFRGLCNMLQVCYNLRSEKSFTKKLEKLVGSRLDQATLDDLLLPSPCNKSYAYDVNLMLKFLKIFLGGTGKKLYRLKKVGFLMDLYLTEVAPDPHIKPCKFRDLVCSLPDVARDSHDRFYEAIDMYFIVHKCITEEEKTRICYALNYNKLLSGSLLHLAKNSKFPAYATSVVQVRLRSKFENHVELRCNSSLSAKEDEQLLVHLLKGRRCKKVWKKSANIAARTDETCPRSLPSLCS